MKLDKVTVAVITYNGEHLLEECLSAVKSQNYPSYEVMMVDNNSTDGSVKLVREKFPEVKILQMKENRGPSPARNAAIREANTRYILLVDDDAILAPDCLRFLMDAVDKFPEAAVWAPRVVYYDKRNTIQYDGGNLHYVGEAINNNADVYIEDAPEKIPYYVQIVAGAVLVVDKEKAIYVGLFDEDYFFGKTDTEFTFRLTLSGFKCISVPRAIVYHKVKMRGLSQVFYQVRNRKFLIFQTYSLKTLFFIIPALLIYEVSLLFFLIFKGELKKYLKANIAVIKNLHQVLNKRRKIQALRKVKDREILFAGDFYIRGYLIKKRYLMLGKKILNGILNIYWKAVKNFI